MHTYTREFAREGGYIGNSPAMLTGIEMIRQAGIREARKAHDARLQVVREFAENPHMFFAAIRPALSTEEAIADANRFLAAYWALPTYRRANRAGQALRAKEQRLYARFFRRHGKRVWALAAAA